MKNTKLKDFHHFKGDTLSRSEKIQRKVIEMILNTVVPDEKREDSIIWELMHISGCIQIGRILAQKRGLDEELAEVICALHEIYSIQTGKYKDHAGKGAEIAAKILKASGDFSGKEMELITIAVANHSDKHIYSDDPYVELIKDADVFDCSLYENSEDYYMIHKPKHIYKEYVKRVKKIRKEIGLSSSRPFRK